MYFQQINLFFRHFKKEPTGHLISLVSLAMGICGAVIMILYIEHELKFDRFHENKDRIYRISMKFTTQDREMISSEFTPAIGPDMKTTFPEVDQYCRIRNPQAGYLSVKNNSFLDENIRYCDSSFFEVFSFELLQGNPHTVLVRPYSIVLETSYAKRLFPDNDPLGKTIILDGKDAFTVTGVVSAPPETSTIQFNNLISFSTLYEDSRLHMGWDGGNQYTTYVQLEEGASLTGLESKMGPFMYEKINEKYEQFGAHLDPLFEPLPEVYLHSAALDSGSPAGSVRDIIIFSLISAFLLLLACINFINLGTAHGSLRGKEVAVRKVLGSQKRTLIRQYLGESLLMSFFSMFLATGLIELLLPQINQVIHKNLQLFEHGHWYLMFVLPGVALLVGFLAGSYPGFFLSSFNPLLIFKGQLFKGLGKQKVRNILVLFQFLISGILIITTLAMNQQLQFMVEKDPGFRRDHMLLVPLIGDEIKSKYEIIKQEVESIPGVLAVTASSNYPGHGLTSNGYVPEGVKDPVMINVLDVDFDFFETYGLKISEGREFSRDFAGDENAYMVNEAFVRKFGWKNPTDKTIERGGVHSVIGVVRDFHFESMQYPVRPLIFTMRPYMGFDYLTIQFGTEDLQALIARIENIWQSIDNVPNFQYTFLSDDLERVYEGEKKMGQLLSSISIIAIGIACMGLFGMAAFTMKQRTKEIVIRKVMGASSSLILKQLIWEHSIWVLVANILAWPVSWYIVSRILEYYAFRIQTPYLIFFLTAMGALFLAWLTIGYNSYRASESKPAESLRYE